MASPSASYVPTLRAAPIVKNEAYSSGVAWPAVIAGAFVAAALWLISRNTESPCDSLV